MIDVAALLPRHCRVHICGYGSCYTCSKISPFQNPDPLVRPARRWAPVRAFLGEKPCANPDCECHRR
jgi:hypothetical protein